MSWLTGLIYTQAFWCVILGMLIARIIHLDLFRRSCRYHNWYCRWVGRPIIMRFYWHVLGRRECLFCCTWGWRHVAKCKKCGFDRKEYEQAEARCWVRDAIRHLGRASREQWVQDNDMELLGLARFLGVEDPHEWINAIALDGEVPEGVNRNRIPAGR